MSWIQDLLNPKMRLWEDFYRNRWQHDRVVRSTHSVNCTGSCSWMVYVKNGLITWEFQALDYPSLEAGLPPYETRGCQRGISFSWYVYSPLRVKYPYIRGVLADLWQKARSQHDDPVAAWKSVVEDEAGRRSYQQARGKGGFRRASWDEVLEIIAASTLYTAKKYGPDRVVGFSPIPAMSMLSYIAGTRFLQLLGGTVLSFYDWYSDFPPAFPETWGEKTDVAESADWFNSKFIVTMGSNLNMTRTPDVHFVAEARNHGAKLVVLSPDFSQVSKYSDWWIPVQAGMDGAFWMAVNHVILKEFHIDRHVEYFTDYLKRYSDMPFLVALEKMESGYSAGRFLRAKTLSRYLQAENADWKFLVFDAVTGAARMPQGSIGFRWQNQKGQWNLQMKDGLDGSPIEPLLSFYGVHDESLPILFKESSESRVFKRNVPVKYIDTLNGRVPVATVFDLLLGHFGIGRGLEGEYPSSFDEEEIPYTPAWQEKFTGVSRETVIRFAREWATTAERTKGRCTVIVGSGANHWFHTDQTYRTAITALMLCGCIGVNGGGLNHYTGQEKVSPQASWVKLAFALDWMKASRLQNAPSFHYIHSDQWRYEREHGDVLPESGPFSKPHAADLQVDAVRRGWLPFFPQFDRNPIDVIKDAGASGAKTDEAVTQWVVGQLKERKLRFAVEDPDAPANWPRVFFIWRGNTLLASAKGHEYFLNHYLGTHHNFIADEVAAGSVHQVHWRDPSPQGKMDLVIDINFRMDTSALYSDIVLPTATWYEKEDLNTTDLHSFIHPFGAAVPPCWESKTDWEIFKAIAKKVSEISRIHFPGPFRDIVLAPLAHDTPDEISQPEVKDWFAGECEPIPGKTMPRMKVVERDYVNLYHRLVSFGPLVLEEGLEEKGIQWPVNDVYSDFLKSAPTVEWGGRKYPSLLEAVDAANVILHFSPETNGEVAYRGFKALEEKVGLPLADLAERNRGIKYNFSMLVRQPRRILTSPCWSGILNNGRAYSAYCMNVERLVPWRTLTGRQHLYLDHQAFIAFEENFPTFKSKIDVRHSLNLDKSRPSGRCIALNYITPHGKWHFHTTYYDNLRMLTLSRGIEPFWLNDKDAEEIGVEDNAWVEAYNDNGVIVTRAVVSARVPRGLCIFYHAPERTISIPKSPLRNFRRAGGHNSLTRLRLKPALMVGGYAQLCYRFNDWGPSASDRDTYVFVRKLEGEPRW